MMASPLDSKQILYLPFWTKLVVSLLFVISTVVSVVIIVRFIGSNENFDWLLLGVTGAQFSITALATFLILCFSQTDATVRNLERRADSFLCELLPAKLAAITFPGMRSERLSVRRGPSRDLFGYDYSCLDEGIPVLRLWCGVNVQRIIVIYFMRDPKGARTPANFVKNLKKIFSFSLGGAESIGYSINYESVPGATGIVSVWVSVAAIPDLLTDSAQKLFWAQDIAMMTESVLRTALRHPQDVRPELDAVPAPL